MKKQEIEVISFDLFGTLVHYKRAFWFWFMIQAGLFSKSSRQIFHEGVLTSVVSNMLLDNIIFRENNFSPEISRLFDKYLQKEIKSIKMYHDVPGLLVRLQSQGYKIAFTSNLAKDFGQPTLDILPIKPDFKIFSYEIGHRKPEQKIFQELIKQSGVSPSKILHIGDKFQNDYVGATNAGMKTILLARELPKNTTTRINFIHTLSMLENLL